MTAKAARHLNLLEKVSHRAEMLPWYAVYRLAIGFGLVPLFTWWVGGDGVDWRLIPFFVFVLLTLRVVPAIVRHVLPVSEDMQAYWFRHRLLAKRFDSYQWRKLLWFGFGLGAHVVLVGHAGPVQTALAAGCLVAGCFGTLAWWRLAGSEQVVAIMLPTRSPAGTITQ